MSLPQVASHDRDQDECINDDAGHGPGDGEILRSPGLGAVIHSPVEAEVLATSSTKASDSKGFYVKEKYFCNLLSFFSEHQINMEFEIGSRRRNINILQVSPVF